MNTRRHPSADIIHRDRVTVRTNGAGRRRPARRLLTGMTAGALAAALGAGLAGPAALASATPRAAAPAVHASGIPSADALGSLVDKVVASTAAPNGDTNPYDLAVVPFSAGKLVAGDVLVADFNDAAGNSGNGMSIVEINPTTGMTTGFAQGGPVAGPVGVAIDPTNDNVWVGNYGAANPADANAIDGSLANVTTFSPSGSVLSTLTGGRQLVGVWGQAVSDVHGQVSFYYPTAGNGTTGLFGGSVFRIDPNPANLTTSTVTQLTSGLAATPAGTNSAMGTAAAPVGPRGLVFDSANDTLYVADDANNTIYAIPAANSATSSATAQVVLSGGPLMSPQQITIDPVNGDLLVVNGATNNDLIEVSTAGQVVATRDLAPNEGAGALFGLTATTDKAGNPVIYYDNANDNQLHVLTTPAPGYWLVAKDGGIFSFGDAGFYGSTGGMHLNQPIMGMASTPTGKGYWLVAKDGGIFSFGDAGFYGSTGAIHLNQPIVGMAPTQDGKGYWLVASDGGIFSFGDATFFGSTGGMHLNQPIVGIAATPTGKGYWLVAKDGGIFSFGDATFFGSTGGMHLNQPIVGIAATPTGKGYWLVASDGGIFAFGDATFLGSTGATHLNQPILGMATTADGAGYWLVASDGGIFSFGDATFYGSTGGVHLNQPVVGLSAMR